VSKMGAAVIGLGMMGQRHGRVWSELTETELVTVYDLVPERARQMADQYGCMAAGSLQEALDAPGVEIVSVCTDDQNHVEPCTAAAAAGKHVLVEKPLATSPHDCDTIIAAARGHGVRLMTGHVVRFDLRYQVAKAAIDDGQVGDIIHLYGRRNNILRSGRRIGPRTSIAYFLGVHDLDIMRWYVGCDAVRVYAESSRKLLTEEGADDTIFTLLKYENDAVGCLETSWVLPEGQPNTLDARLEVVGTEGRVAVRVGDSEPLEVSGPDRSWRPDIAYGPVVYDQQAGAIRHQLEHFARCIRDEQEFIITPEDARAAVVLADAIHRSLETGMPAQLG